jgi:hypothetical protein
MNKLITYNIITAKNCKPVIQFTFNDRIEWLYLNNEKGYFDEQKFIRLLLNDWSNFRYQDFKAKLMISVKVTKSQYEYIKREPMYYIPHFDHLNGI